jgi:putative ABC transport system substrate-binding protein
MRRREFIKVIAGSVAVWPFVTRAQQPAMPVVGLLRSTAAAPFNNLVVALREGLKETGFVEGSTVVIEQRWADNQDDRLPVTRLARLKVFRKVAGKHSGYAYLLKPRHVRGFCNSPVTTPPAASD